MPVLPYILVFAVYVRAILFYDENKKVSRKKKTCFSGELIHILGI